MVDDPNGQFHVIDRADNGRDGLDWLGAMSGRLLDPDPLKRQQLSAVS